MRTKRWSAFSLVELLVCVAIIGVLASIATVSYMGAVDASDVRAALEDITARLEKCRSKAQSEGLTIEVEFVRNTAQMRVTSHKDGAPKPWEVSVEHFDATTLLKRRPVFRNYRWPDGSRTPRTFTFSPTSPSQGGEVTFGTGFAAGRIFLNEGRPDWNL